jgi:hypothetical protein
MFTGAQHATMPSLKFTKDKGLKILCQNFSLLLSMAFTEIKTVSPNCVGKHARIAFILSYEGTRGNGLQLSAQ